MGYLSAYIIFIALNSPSFCNTYLRDPGAESDHGILSLAEFMYICGMLFLITTVIVALLKSEEEEEEEGGEEERERLMMGERTSNISKEEEGERKGQGQKNGHDHDIVADVQAAYIEMWRVSTLTPVRILCIMLVTCRIGFAAADSVTSLRLIQHGVPKETLAMLGVALAPLEVRG